MLLPFTEKNQRSSRVLRRTVCSPILLVVALLLNYSFPSNVSAVTESQVTSIRSSILALGSARTSAVKELDNVSLSTKEAADYLDFVVYLNTRIVNYCRELEQLGAIALLEELPCPAMASSGSGQQGVAPPVGELTSGSASSGPPAQTRAERTGALQGEFLEALGDFDEMLLREEDQLATRIPSQRETGGGGQGGTGGQPGTAGGSDESGSGQTSSASQPGEGSAGELSAGELSGGQTASGGAGAAPADQGAEGRGGSQATSARAGAPGGNLPPPEDDDIVARQLREAAEKEPDPELKKKLWEEYWKYKGVVRE